MPRLPIEPYYTELGVRVRARRRDLGLNQEDVAKSMHPRLTRAAIANIETGKQRVRAHTLWELARVLNVSPIALVADDGHARVDRLEAVTRELRTKLPSLSAERLAGLSKKAVSRIPRGTHQQRKGARS